MTDTWKSIVNLIPYENFTQSHFLDSKFIPILQLKPDLNMGLSENGNWVVEGKNSIYILTTPESYGRVVVLLERSIYEVSKELKIFFANVNIDADIDLIFPFIDIVRAGLGFGTIYWAELAFKWFDELPVTRKVELKDSLEKIKGEKWISQRLRHKVIKELKRVAKVD